MTDGMLVAVLGGKRQQECAKMRCHHGWHAAAVGYVYHGEILCAAWSQCVACYWLHGVSSCSLALGEVRLHC